MCGLFGFQLRRGMDTSVLTAVLASHSELRGDQSWGGVFDGDIRRGLGGWPAGYCADRDLMAHTRWATHGDVCVANAHPLEVGDIVGCHNGIITNHEQLNRDGGRDYTVDSYHIFDRIDREAWLGDLEGYGAITFSWRHEPHIVWCAGAPLSVWQAKWGLVWASTAHAVESAVRLAGWRGGRMLCLRSDTFYRLENGRVERCGRLWHLGRRTYEHWNS